MGDRYTKTAKEFVEAQQNLIVPAYVKGRRNPTARACAVGPRSTTNVGHVEATTKRAVIALVSQTAVQSWINAKSVVETTNA